MTSRFSRRLVIVLAGTLGAGSVLSAQQPVEAPAAAAKAASPAAQPPAPPPFSYDPQGRRDPFVSLLARGADPRTPASRPAGIAGLLVAEVSVKGLLKDRTGVIGLLVAPDGRTHIVRQGDKLLDGSVKSILPDAIVFLEDVTDPLSPVKQREIRKAVRAAEGGRQ